MATRTALALLTVVAPSAAFAVLAQAVSGGGDVALDRELVGLSEDFYERETAWGAAEALLRVSIGLGAALAIAVLGLLLWRRRLRSGLFWALAVGGVLVLDPLLKAAVRRPGIGAAADEWSFPSGNAMASLAIALAAVLLLWTSPWRRPAVVLAAAAVALEGIGLVLLGWHYASDVLAGWCAAVAWVALLSLSIAHPGENPAKSG